MVSERTMALAISLVLLSLFVVACSTSPGIIEHPRPVLTVDEEIFSTITRTKGCYTSDLYGGLEPNYPAAYCYTNWVSGNQCLRESGGFIQICEQVAVYLDGTFQFIGTREDLRDLFAPIESGDEALSYALLATGYSTKYEPEDYRLAVPGDCDPGPKKYRYYVDSLEDTHVVEVESGYQVHLFDSETFGCGPHPVWSVMVQVNHDGTIASGHSQKLFEEDESAPMCCVD